MSPLLTSPKGEEEEDILNFTFFDSNNSSL